MTRAQSSDASLDKFVVNDGTADADVMADTDGAFAHSVGYDVMQVTVSAMAGHADASAEITSPDDADGDAANRHQVDLDVGATEVTATVTAQDGTTMEHTLTVTRAASSDVSLSSVMVGDDEVMAGDDGTYSHDVGNDVAMATIAATATHADATVSYSGDDADDDAENGHQAALDVGANTITITVTAGDGMTADYMLTVNRAAAPGISVSMEAINVTEGGDATAVTYQVSLATEPTADVTVAIATHIDADDDGNPDDAAADVSAYLTLSTASRTFTPSNYDIPQNVVVTAPEENTDTENHEVTLIHTATSTDLNYGDDLTTTGADENESKTANVAVTVKDDDANTPAITVDPATLSIPENAAETEAEEPNTFTVVLGAGTGTAATGQPVGGNVTVTIPVPAGAGFSLSDAGGNSAAAGGELELTFTADNFRTAQTVTVNPVNDEIQSQTPGSEAAGPLTATATGGGYDDEVDAGGNAVTAPTGAVGVTITEDDEAAVTVSATSLQLLEGGDADTYTISLGSDPGGNVNFTVTSSNNAAAAVSPAFFTLNSSNREQVVTVTPGAVDANVTDITITNAILSAPAGNGYTPGDGSVDNVTVDVLDNETAQVLVTPTALSIALVRASRLQGASGC